MDQQSFFSGSEPGKNTALFKKTLKDFEQDIIFEEFTGTPKGSRIVFRNPSMFLFWGGELLL